MLRRENMKDLVKEIEKKYKKTSLPKFNIGDTVKVYFKIIEGDRTRIQVFEGTVIAEKGEGIRKTLTVRKISHGEGIERVFPLHSPFLEKIEVVRKGRVRRAKLYYLRKKIGKKAKVKEKIKSETDVREEVNK
jgi:large subunit ribosomal protein L19